MAMASQSSSSSSLPRMRFTGRLPPPPEECFRACVLGHSDRLLVHQNARPHDRVRPLFFFLPPSRPSSSWASPSVRSLKIEIPTFYYGGGGGD